MRECLFWFNNSLFTFTTQRSLNFESSENLNVLTLDFVLFQFIAAQNTMIFRFKRSHQLGELQN